MAGCGVAPTEQASAKAAPKTTRDAAPKLPDTVGGSKLYIVSDAARLNVGMDVDLVLNDAKSGGFRRPERSTSINRMPPGFDAAYRCYGWETPNRSFGVITRGREVVLALDTYERADQKALDDLSALFTTRFGTPTSINGTRVHYDFWQDGSDRLMLCSTLDEVGNLSFTVALGNVLLMDYFRMDSSSAIEDQTTADKLFTSK
ncbi:MAG: hypothetical protein JSS65_12465 [Armatimonadetes bacterium]|nr:hypothetical protein [Armatimonadota bacterium]